MADTEWDRYGTGKNPKCANCMVHCGFEATAVNDTFAHPLKAAKVALFGPETDGPMAPELPILYKDEAPQLKLVVKAETVRSCGTNSDQRAAGQQ
jgi:hypothetical protein